VVLFSILLREYKKTDWILINGTGNLPDFQGTGAYALLYAEVEKTIRQYPQQFMYLEMVQIQGTAAKMISNVNTLEGRIHKTHRIYQYQFQRLCNLRDSVQQEICLQSEADQKKRLAFDYENEDDDEYEAKKSCPTSYSSAYSS